MAEEFQESEVVFGQDNDEVIQKSADEESNEEVVQKSADEQSEEEYGYQIRRNNNNVSIIRKVTMKPNSNSIPVQIPDKASFFKYDDDDDDDDEDEMVTPHVLISRRIATRMTSFSVCAGYTLKGRDLFQLRNIVLRMTGFLEASL